MARSTRQQRRQRRAQAAGTPPLRPAPRARPTTEEEPPRQPRRGKPPSAATTSGSGVPGVRFLQESWAELKKVEWPNQQQLVSGTAVVLVACLITGVYLYANDRLWEYVVSTCAAEVEERTNVPLVRDQHLLRAREQGEGQSRAPDRVDEPTHALPARRRPDRAGDRDEGRPEGAGREARRCRATCS